jgi:hypothetical protein
MSTLVRRTKSEHRGRAVFTPPEDSRSCLEARERGKVRPSIPVYVNSRLIMGARYHRVTDGARRAVCQPDETVSALSEV